MNQFLNGFSTWELIDMLWVIAHLDVFFPFHGSPVTMIWSSYFLHDHWSDGFILFIQRRIEKNVLYFKDAGQIELCVFINIFLIACGIVILPYDINLRKAGHESLRCIYPTGYWPRMDLWFYFILEIINTGTVSFYLPGCPQWLPGWQGFSHLYKWRHTTWLS